jgi:hypothetical protein
MTAEEYWKQNVQFQDQKFYTAVCLLSAACSDYAIGIELSETKLTWAATALYYSMVHCGRLACFLALGDFPKSHSKLADLFLNGKTNGSTWMMGFKRFLDAEELEPEGSFSCADMVTHFRGLLPEASNIRAEFKVWGEIFSSARILRNDSSYEGLLIAHEYNHKKVTHALENLVRLLRRASETVLPQAISFMKAFVSSSERTEHWFAFLNWKEKREGLYYIEESLNKTINNQATLITIHEFLSPLRRTADPHLNLASTVGMHIEVGVFGGKASLMDAFEVKIATLEEQLENANAL